MKDYRKHHYYCDEEEETLKRVDRGIVIFCIILAAIACFCLFGCRTVRTEYVPVEIHTVDSITVRDSVVQLQLVPYKDSVATPDTTSYLFNTYGYSWARWSGGLLHHSLGIFPQRPMDFTLPVVTRTIYKEREKIVYKDRPLTRWQQTCLNYGGEALVACALGTLALVAWLVWRFRRK